MKVPFSVISGKSPMKTSCSFTSPVSLFISLTLTLSGAAYVTSLSLHSSCSYFGGSFKGIIYKFQNEIIRIVLDRRYVFKHFSEAFLNEPIIRFGLYLYQVRHLATSLIFEKVIRSFLPNFTGFGIFITPYISQQIAVQLHCVAVYYNTIRSSISQAFKGNLRLN